MLGTDGLDRRIASASSSSSVLIKPPSKRGMLPVTTLPDITTLSNGHLAISQVDHSISVLGPMTGKGKGKAVVIAQRHSSDAIDLEPLTDTERNEDDDYERYRQRNIDENRLLLNSLGIQQTIADRARASSSYTRRTPSSQGKLLFDRSGHVVSLPGPGEVHQLACVELSTDRKLSRRIAEGEYHDCSRWTEGEARRRRFGSGCGGRLQDGEPEEVGGVGADFRWRRWRGLQKELEKEMSRRGELIERDSRPVREVVGKPSAYSLIPGETCHQCRRKSEKAKMKCRNVDPVCRATFCETCCKRYSYFSFDPDSRSFICPLCRECCNCSNCIRKRNLAHLLGPGRTGISTKSLLKTAKEQGSGEITVEAFIQKAIEDRIGAPFDRVRLVDQGIDIISPDLPEEVIQVAESVKKRKKGGPGRPKKQARIDNDEGTQKRTIFKIKVPKAAESTRHAGRQKEVDSDGDTVGGWSDEDDGGQHLASFSSDLTPFSHSASPVPKRLPFPPRSLEFQQALNDAYNVPYSDFMVGPDGLEHPYHEPMGATYPLLPDLLNPDIRSPQADGLPTPMSEQANDYYPNTSPTRHAPSHLIPHEQNGGLIRKRKPPPKSGILRIPRPTPHPAETSPPPSQPYRALNDASRWHSSYEQLDNQLDPLSTNDYYGHYPSTYPATNPYPSPATITPHMYPPTLSALESSYLQFGPPPYSQSSIPQGDRQPVSNNGLNDESGWPQNLDLLSLAAAEARHSPSGEGHQ